jgi:hypothetical protein
MLQTPLYIGIAVALLCFILYALDRRSRSEPVEWASAMKLSTFGSLIGAGIAFVLTPGDTTLKVLPEIVPSPEMFVGTPSF